MGEPLFLQSVMQEKIWGGSRLSEVFGYEIPSPKTGEYWAISAHPNGVSVIANGRYQGKPLDQLYAEERHLFGKSESPVFPLLTKILDADDWLSVQVHPDDAYAMAHEGELGKTECWYVIAAEKGAEIIYGHTAKSKEELAKKIADGDWEELLMRVPVQAGDFFYVPSGTMHAIGKGILILETQQSSDTTYRVYDFERTDAQGRQRELHIQDSINVMGIGPVANSHPDTVSIGEMQVTTYISNEFFTVYKWQVAGQARMKQAAPYYLVSVLAGSGRVSVAGQTYPLSKGSHFILPSDVKVWTFEGDLDMLVSHP